MSAPLPGYVYFDKNFKFHDGKIGKKLFVILCDSTLDDDNVLVARTTSRPKSVLVHGCYLDKYPPCYCLPSEINNFNDDTWIMLDYISELEKVWCERVK